MMKFDYDVTDVDKAFTKLVKVTDQAAANAVAKVAGKQRPALLSFDNTETIAVPSKRSVTLTVTGPNLSEDADNGYLSEVLDQQAQEIVQEMLTDISQSLKGVLR